MKKKIVWVLIALMATTTTVFAQEISLVDKYSTQLQVVQEGKEYISLEDVVKKTIANSTDIKKTNASIELSEKELDRATISAYDTASLIALISKQVSYKNSLISKETKNEALAFSVKQTYIDIILAQREIALTEEKLVTEKTDLKATEIKNKMGQVSDSEYETKKLSYEKSVQTLEKTKMQLEANYISLNILMGVDVNKRYSFALEAEYEKVDIASLDGYITAAVANNPNVITQTNSLEVSKQQITAAILSGTDGGAYDSAVNNYNTAEMNLVDVKENLEQSYRNLYNSIVQGEQDMDTLIKELDTLKKTLETTKLKYNAGQVSKVTLENAENALATKENAIVSALYTHMLNAEKFSNYNLM